MLSCTRMAWRAAALSRRAMSTATDFNWDALIAKMPDDASRDMIRTQRNNFQARLAATQKAGDPPSIDWQSYEEALPEHDISAIKAQFEQYMDDLPNIPYDESADLAEHSAKEERARKLQQLSFVRSDELATLLEEAEDFKLHEYTTANDMYLRHPGLYEELQQKLLDRENFEDLEAPEKRTELTPEEIEAIELDLMKKGGLSYEEWKGQA